MRRVSRQRAKHGNTAHQKKLVSSMCMCMCILSIRGGFSPSSNLRRSTHVHKEDSERESHFKFGAAVAETKEKCPSLVGCGAKAVKRVAVVPWQNFTSPASSPESAADSTSANLASTRCIFRPSHSPSSWTIKRADRYASSHATKEAHLKVCWGLSCRLAPQSAFR